MRDLPGRLVGGALHPMLFVFVVCPVLAALLSSCSTGLPIQREVQEGEEDSPPVPYSIVCIIHGDGDYLYHDTSGNGHNADEEALAGAKRVAQQNPSAEVFIFHQRPRRHFLLFFPLQDGEFYYYRRGQLIINERYWRDREESQFGPEVELYHRFHAHNQGRKASVFLYYGHEVPEFGGAGYNASSPDRPFTVHDLAVGLAGLAHDSARFDLMVLSTCFGGTPYTIGTLGSFARYIIASPDNLHLSYFDLHSLERLDLGLQDGDMPAFANHFARQAFDRLTGEIQTAVSVAVYDMNRVQEFLHSAYEVYDHTLTGLKGETMSMIEHCDCADLPAYLLPTINDGTTVFYRPARFGKSTHKQTHSGWECWKKRKVQASSKLDGLSKSYGRED